MICERLLLSIRPLKAALLPFLLGAAIASTTSAQSTVQDQKSRPLEAASQPGTRPSATIKVQVNQVLVPVVVTDKHGHSVTGLKADDFQVFEDGQPQRLTAFSTQSGLTAQTLNAGAPPSPAALPAPAAAIIPGGAPRRTYLVCLDTLNSAFENLAGVRRALDKLFKQEERGSAGAGSSQYALVAIGRQPIVLHNLTRDPEKILAALDDKQMTAAISHGENGNLAEQVSELSRILSNYCGRCPCAGEAAATGRLATGSDQVCTGKLNAIEMWASSAAQERTQLAHSFLENMRTLVEQIGEQPGKRILVFISDGFNLRPARDLFGMIAAYVQNPSEEEQNTGEWLQPQLEAVERMATSRNVTVYTLDSRGLQATPGGGFDASEDVEVRRETVIMPQIAQQRELTRLQNTDALSELAEATGGVFYHDNNDMFRGLRQAFEDGREYYLLAYESPHKTSDGKFREIRVEVKGKGLVVRAKRGYWAPGPS
jgi:VWFA-related protein